MKYTLLEYRGTRIGIITNGACCGRQPYHFNFEYFEIMEELLNKLIEKGWKPFDVKGISEYFFESVPVGLYRLCWKKPDYDYNVYSKRDLVSKESGLWQFVCENGLLNVNKEYEWEYWTQSYKRNGEEYTHEFSRWCENYRIIESALCNEDELDKFLLENIKIS